MAKNFSSKAPASFALEVADAYGRIGVGRSAAALSYFLILTLFPLLLCLNYIIGFFHISLEQLLVLLQQFIPAGVVNVIRDYLLYVSSVQSPALLLAAIITILISASAGLRTLFYTMDDLYQVYDKSLLSRFLPSLILSFLLVPTIYLSVVVIFTGDWFFRMLERHIPLQIRVQIPLDLTSKLWLWMRYLLLFCFVLLSILVVYRVGTPKKKVKFRGVFLPALWTSVALVACSGLFSWFIGMSARYALVYGSLASLMILLVWLYFCGNILLIGAVAGRVWQAKKGML